MGLLIYYCMSGGQHAFGGPYEREGNILLVSRCYSTEQPAFMQHENDGNNTN